MRLRPLALLAAFAILAGVAMTPPAEAVVTFNEIRVDQVSVDDDEYIELAGTPLESLDGMSIIVLGDSSSSDAGGGAIEAIIDLQGFSIQADGFFVIAESTFPSAFLTGTPTPDITVNMNLENSQNSSFLLVTARNDSLIASFAGSDVDQDDDGSIDADGDWTGDGSLDGAPWSSILDSVALIGDGSLITYGPTVGPDPTNGAPVHIYKCSDTGVWMFGLNSSDAFDTPDAVNVGCLSPVPTFVFERRDPCVPIASEQAKVIVGVRNSTSAKAIYSVDGVAAGEVALNADSTKTDTTFYSGFLPGQGSNGALVEYFIRAYNANPDSSDNFDQGYFVGTVSIGDLRVNDGLGNNIYEFYGARVQGNVTVEFGKFSGIRTDGYIQDATGGINVFEFDIHPVFQAASPGDLLTVAGILDQFNGKLEITADVSVCDTLLIENEGAGAVPAPKEIQPCGVNESNEGLLVKLVFAELDTAGTNGLFGSNQSLDIDNCAASTSLDVFIDGDTDIPGNAVTSAQYEVTGIVTQFGGYDLAPRQLSDLTPVTHTVGVGDSPRRHTLGLLQNSPNPFRSFSEIHFQVPSSPGAGEHAPVFLDVFDVQGRKVATLVDELLGAGEYSVTVDRNKLGIGTGVYFYRLDVGGETLTRKLIVE
jgi:hypothetical protein